MSESLLPGGDEDENDPPPAAASRRRRRRRRWLIPVGVLLALALVIGGGTFFYASSLERQISQNLNRGAELPQESGRPTRPSPESGSDPDAAEPMNFVLMGSDSRDMSDPGSGRSDTLIVAHLSGDRQKAYLVSFPRDMWVEIPGHGEAKINAAFAFGGTSLTVQTLESMLDTRMDHLGVVNFEGFVELTDAVGGVTIDNDYTFSAQGMDFPRGELELDGERALVFVRERYALPNGDFDRAENQRKVVRAIVAKGISPGVIADPRRFTSFVGGIARYTSVDSGLTDEVIRDTALSLRLNGEDDIESLQAPVSGTGTSEDGQSIDIVDEAQLAELGQALSQDTMDEYLEKYPEE